MARPKEEELGDDFSYILRMADTDMDGLKPLASALTSIKGVGHRTAIQICKNTGFDPGRAAGFCPKKTKTASENLLIHTHSVLLHGCSIESETSNLVTTSTSLVNK